MRNHTQEPTLLIRPYGDWLYQRIACLKNLRLLSASTTILEAAALQFVGTLPHLDTLEIHGLSPLPFPILVVDLPDTSFSMLRTLNISSLKIEEYQSLWKNQLLVAQLTTVRIVICEHSDTADTKSLLRQICAGSPKLVNLVLRFLKQYYEKLSPDTFSSLRHISIRNIATFGLYLPTPKETCKVFAAACPLLSELQMETWSVSVSELQYFAQLSELTYLIICVNWESCIDLGGMSSRPAYVSEQFRRLEWTKEPGTSVEPWLIGITTRYVGFGHTFRQLIILL